MNVKVYFPIIDYKAAEGPSKVLSEEELEQISPRYRPLLKLFLKLPNPSFPFFIVRKLPFIEGIFWAVILPIVLLIYFLFSIWLVAFLSLHVIFPLNIMLGLSIPTTFFIFFLRVELGRTIFWWKRLQYTRKEWNVSKVVEEFAELAKKQKRRQTGHTTS